MKTTRMMDLPLEKRMELYEKAMELREKKGWGACRVGNRINVSEQTVEGWFYQGVNPKNNPRIKRFPLTKNELDELYWKEGLSTRQIGKKIEFSHSTIKYWMRKYNIPSRPKYFKIEPDLSRSQDLVYLLALVLGDGCVSKYSVRFASIHKELVDEFCKVAKKIGVNPNTRLQSPSGRFGDSCWIGYFTSIVFCDWYKKVNIPRLKNLVKDNEKAFIKGMYEAEGSLTYSSCHSLQLYICNTDQKLINFLSELVTQLGCRHSIRYEKREERKDMYRLYIQGGNRAVAEFIGKINPLIKNEIPSESINGTLEKNYWTDKEIKFLKNNYQNYTYREIADILNRTKPSVGQKAREIGLRKQWRWTDKEINFLKDNYKDYTNRELSKRLDRGKGSVRWKVRQIGLGD